MHSNANGFLHIFAVITASQEDDKIGILVDYALQFDTIFVLLFGESVRPTDAVAWTHGTEERAAG